MPRQTSWDGKLAEREILAAYHENGRPYPPKYRHVTDLDFPDLAAPFSCACGSRFQVRRDRDRHEGQCVEIIEAIWTASP